MKPALSRAAHRWGFAAIYRRRSVTVADRYSPRPVRLEREDPKDAR